METKKCTRCKHDFLLNEMRRSYCKSCKTEIEKQRNPDRRKWNLENKELNRKYSNKYTSTQLQNPLRKLQWNCNSGISRAITLGWYNSKQLEIWVGLTPDELKCYLQSKWSEGMNWENYGRKSNCWSVDHIIPPYNVQTEQEIITLQYYTNLRPLWHSDNIKKGNK
jgi:hypothetical protein